MWIISKVKWLHAWHLSWQNLKQLGLVIGSTAISSELPMRLDVAKMVEFFKNKNGLIFEWDYCLKCPAKN